MLQLLGLLPLVLAPGTPPISHGAAPGPAAPELGEEAPQEEAPQSTEAALPAAARPATAATTHRLTVGDLDLAYSALAGTLRIHDEEEGDLADVFYVAYLASDVERTEARPVTFVFNGGPGSSSVWLHLGAFGPKRVEMTAEGFPTQPPYRLVPNEGTLLGASDLVFIDPPTTGYSRPLEGVESSAVHGVEQDAAVVAEFIRRWTTQAKRWGSPKFLAGESYGTTRAAAVADRLQDRHGMYLNGIVLVSSILNFQTARFEVGNDLPYPLFLPTYTATAWFHGRLDEELSADLESTLRRAEAFASGAYASALMKGARLEDPERDAVRAELARLTGLSEDYLEACDLRPVIHAFVKELRREEGITVGRLDSRFTGRDRLETGERYEYDPSMAAIRGPYTATLNAYLREELEYVEDLPYEILSGRVRPWDWSAENAYLNVAERLRSAMTKNTALKVYVANGLYDLATPYYATHYTFDHMQLAPELRANVILEEYPSGHMMYIQRDSLVRLRERLEIFYGWATNDAGSAAARPGAR